MSLLTEEYREQLEELHTSRADFGKRGNRWAGTAMAMCGAHDTTDVLDYGCGKGELNLHMPFEVHCYDPGVPKHSSAPEPADVVVCTDVLEHIEPECLDDVLADLKRVVKKVALLAIHTGPAIKTLPDGRNAHLIQEKPEWWKDKLEELFTIKHHENMGADPITAVFAVEARP